VTLAGSITGGIPPDRDHLALMGCSYRNCRAVAEREPLVVVALVGKMAVLCRAHYDLLTGRIRGPVEVMEP
jgi:hypothetical protein